MISTIFGWSLTAAPTSPTFGVSLGMSPRIFSFGTMRMPPFVERRITQYLQPREQPRSVSMRNMFANSACGVRIGPHAGKSSSSMAAMLASSLPWRAGTVIDGSFASPSSCASRVSAV